MHKTNVLTYAGDLWQRTVDAVAKEFPDVDVDYCHVDAATMFFVTDPERFDVIVTDNLFGDILTDLGAAIAGGIGLAASGNINPERHRARACSSRCTAARPDIAGQGKADPTAAVCRWRCCSTTSACPTRPRRVEQAVADDLVERQARVGRRGDRARSATTSPRVTG